MRRRVEVLITPLWQAATMERRVVLVVGSVIVVLTLLATVLPHALGVRTTPAPVPRVDASAPEGPFPTESFPPESFSSFPPVPEGCPAPVTEMGTHVTVNWVPLVVADGREYWGETSHAGLVAGPEVVTVKCDIPELSGGGQAMMPRPWPDGSSTVLPAGVAVHEVVGSPRECFLMTDVGVGVDWLFRAVDADGGTPEACIGVPDP